jgi:hypothetical protein
MNVFYDCVSTPKKYYIIQQFSNIVLFGEYSFITQVCSGKFFKIFTFLYRFLCAELKK